MRKLALTLSLLGILVYAEGKVDLLKKDDNSIYFRGGNSNDIASMGIGAKYQNVSLEAIYKKDLNYNEKDLKNYFKSGNTIGVRLTLNPFDYNESAIDKSIKNIAIANISKAETDEIERPNIRIDYKLRDRKNLVDLISNLSKKSNPESIQVNVNSIEKDTVNENRFKKTITLLKKLGSNLEKKYGELPEKDLLQKENLNNREEKIVLKFDRR